jgi:hypothetical protein
MYTVVMRLASRGKMAGFAVKRQAESIKAADGKNAYNKQYMSLINRSKQGRQKPKAARIGSGRQA